MKRIKAESSSIRPICICACHVFMTSKTVLDYDKNMEKSTFLKWKEINTSMQTWMTLTRIRDTAVIEVSHDVILSNIAVDKISQARQVQPNYFLVYENCVICFSCQTEMCSTIETHLHTNKLNCVVSPCHKCKWCNPI